MWIAPGGRGGYWLTYLGLPLKRGRRESNSHIRPEFNAPCLSFVFFYGYFTLSVFHLDGSVQLQHYTLPSQQFQQKRNFSIQELNFTGLTLTRQMENTGYLTLALSHVLPGSGSTLSNPHSLRVGKRLLCKGKLSVITSKKMMIQSPSLRHLHPQKAIHPHPIAVSTGLELASANDMWAEVIRVISLLKF